MKIANLFICFIALILTVSACTTTPQQNSNMEQNDVADQDSGSNSGEEMEENDDVAVGSEIDETKDSKGNDFQGQVLAGTTTKYIDFNNEDYEKALAKDKTIILNFYANWCPKCKAEQPAIFETFEGMDDSNIIGFRVNWRDSDTESIEEDLARKYGITTQGSKIFIKKGTQILKQLGHWSKQEWAENIDVL